MKRAEKLTALIMQTKDKLDDETFEKLLLEQIEKEFELITKTKENE